MLRPTAKGCGRGSGANSILARWPLLFGAPRVAGQREVTGRNQLDYGGASGGIGFCEVIRGASAVWFVDHQAGLNSPIDLPAQPNSLQGVFSELAVSMASETMFDTVPSQMAYASVVSICQFCSASSAGVRSKMAL